jgi:hypothetical protein
MHYHTLDNNYANVPSVVSRETRMMLKLSGTQQSLVYADDCNLVGEPLGFAKKKTEKRIQFLRDIKQRQE